MESALAYQISGTGWSRAAFRSPFQSLSGAVIATPLKIVNGSGSPLRVLVEA
jgi:hypothetical protein